MGDFVSSIRNAWLDDFTSTTKYLALFDGDPQGAGTEISGGAYARVAIAAADWAAATGDGTVTNSAKKSFPQATADWNGGATISHWAIMDAATVGNVEASDALTVAKAVTNGDTAEFDIGEIDLSVS